MTLPALTLNEKKLKNNVRKNWLFYKGQQKYVCYSYDIIITVKIYLCIKLVILGQKVSFKFLCYSRDFIITVIVKTGGAVNIDYGDIENGNIKFNIKFLNRNIKNKLSNLVL